MRVKQFVSGLGLAVILAFGAVMLHAKNAKASGTCDQIAFDFETSGGFASFQPAPEFAGLFEWWGFVPDGYGGEYAIGYPWTDHQYCAWE